MPKYVLHYFDLKGRAEAARLLFRLANVEFEDHRISKDEWAELKKDERVCPFGQLPSLEIDGEVIAQSSAITRYLANEFGLYGKTNLEKAKNDMIAEGLRDIGMNMIAFFKEKDEERKAVLKKAFFEEQLPQGLKVFEEKFAPKDGFFTGDSVALGDVIFFAMIQFFDDMKPNSLENFPKLKALWNRFAETPNVKKYLESQKK